MKKKIKERDLKTVIFILLFFCLICIGLLLGGYINRLVRRKKLHTPIEYCLTEIKTHEGFEEFAYFYQDIKNADETQYDTYCYYITTFDDEKKTEWFCYVAAYHKYWFDNKLTYKKYTPDEIVVLDCDVTIQTIYNGWVY